MEIDIRKCCSDLKLCRKFENSEDYDIFDNIFIKLSEYKSKISLIEQLEVHMNAFDNENYSESFVHTIQDGFYFIFKENNSDLDDLIEYFIDNIDIMYPHASKWCGFFILMFLTQFDFTDNIVKAISKIDKSNYHIFKNIMDYVYEVEFPEIEELGWYNNELVKQNLNKISLTINRMLLK